MMNRIFLKFFLFCSFFLFTQPLTASPFSIDFPPKEHLDPQDYLLIQEQLRAIDLYPLLHKLYPPNQGFTTIEDFYNRSSRGLSQILIDEERGFFPLQNLEKIGNGGDNCFVCCVPFGNNRSFLLDKIINELKTTGFNGYFYYRKGGFPNPTGKEIQYAGVPYCFKIFMMLEASKLGFNKVMWIDAACMPLRDPTPLFEWLDQQGSLCYGWHPYPSAWIYILPSTWQLLKGLTGTNVLADRHLTTRIFGLKMDTILAEKLINEYYKFVELGTPFLSCFPEEFVLSSIMGKSDYSSQWEYYPYDILRGADEPDDTEEKIQERRDQGYFFYHLRH